MKKKNEAIILKRKRQFVRFITDILNELENKEDVYKILNYVYEVAGFAYFNFTDELERMKLK